jgi:heterodisulfide reductase subunit A
MYALKLAHLARDSVKAEVVEFYRDMRTFGKDYEHFFHRVEGEGVHFHRFDEDPTVTRANAALKVSAHDPFTGWSTEEFVDMVILSTGLEPQADQPAVARIFGVSRSPDGFFLEKHPKLAPVETATDGVYLAGTCQGPKDIPDTVAQGSAAAAAALALMDAGSVALEPFTSYVDPVRCGACRTCEGLCPYKAIAMVKLDGRQVAEVNEVLCKGCGACAAACPSGAIRQRGFTDDQVEAEIQAILVAATGF